MSDTGGGEGDSEPIGTVVRRAVVDVSRGLVVRAVLIAVGFVGLALVLMTVRAYVGSTATPVTGLAGVFGLAAVLFARYELERRRGSAPGDTSY